MRDTQKYKEQLEEMLAELTEELKTIGVHNPAVKEDWIAKPESANQNDADPNINADHVEDWNERRAVVATLETRYNNITRALQKIEDGTYGTCEVCGEPIADERLDANPAARTCSTHMDEEDSLTND